MKMKTTIFLGVIILGAAIFAWLPFSKKVEQTPITIASVKQTTNNALTVSQTQQVNAETKTQEASAKVIAPEASQTSQTNMDIRREQFRSFIDNENKPIEFYGKVVDQDKNPIEGAKIRAQSREWFVTPSLGVDARFPITDATSDAAGKFEIHGIKGDGFGIKFIQKDGFELEGKQHGFGPSGGSDNDPVIFRMWKTNIHEQLIIGEKRFHIAISGQPYFIDLKEGAISQSAGGDLKVWIKFPAETNIEQTNNWMAEIGAVNGGLLEEHDPYSSMYLAPEGDYTQTFQIARQLVRKNQRGMTGQHRFYLMLENGKEYGRFSIELFAPYNDQISGLIDIKYAINPSGSRILKP